ncbi:MAG: ABC transporter ATP-binding protein [Pseudomonadota bacterium]
MAMRYPRGMAIALATTVVAAIFQLMIPQYLGEAVDSAQGLLAGGDQTAAQAALWQAAGLLLGASVLRGLFTMWHNYQGEAVGQRIAYDLRMAYYAQLQRLSFGFHDRVHTGELITRGMLDIEGIRMLINAGVIRLVLITLLVSVGATLLLSREPLLGLIALSFVPFAAWRSVVARMRLRASWLALQEKLGVLTRVMEENLGGIRVVRAFAAQPHEMAKFDVVSDETLELADRRLLIRVRNTSAMTYAFFVAMGLLLWVGGAQVIAGEITVGTLAEYLAFMAILQLPVRQLGMMVNAFARASMSGSRLFEVLDREPEISDRIGASDLVLGETLLCFEHVSFAYPGAVNSEGQQLATLHDISFEIRAGQTLGIVGPPGSGKSTIAHLIPRYYDVSSGRIMIDGQDVRQVTLDSLRRAVSLVQQDSFLFTASIENNIAYGDPWAERERIAQSSEVARLHDYVAGLPGGYETLVGERGVSLSGGQRQRLSIARSILLSPPILVFDDSTAAVDAGTEKAIRDALRAQIKSQATIIIAHRLGSLMEADEIIFLDTGRIVERGSHAELLKLGGRYASLYALQSAGADRQEPAT